MDKYTILKQNSKKSMRLIGIEIEMFNSILEKVKKYVEEEKANNPIAHRGIESELSVANQLFY